MICYDTKFPKTSSKRTESLFQVSCDSAVSLSASCVKERKRNVPDAGHRMSLLQVSCWWCMWTSQWPVPRTPPRRTVEAFSTSTTNSSLHLKARKIHWAITGNYSRLMCFNSCHIADVPDDWVLWSEAVALLITQTNTRTDGQAKGEYARTRCRKGFRKHNVHCCDFQENITEALGEHLWCYVSCSGWRSEPWTPLGSL